jgi:hypothetical protein
MSVKDYIAAIGENTIVGRVKIDQDEDNRATKRIIELVTHAHLTKCLRVYRAITLHEKDFKAEGINNLDGEGKDIVKTIKGVRKNLQHLANMHTIQPEDIKPLGHEIIRKMNVSLSIKAVCLVSFWDKKRVDARREIALDALIIGIIYGLEKPPSLMFWDDLAEFLYEQGVERRHNEACTGGALLSQYNRITKKDGYSEAVLDVLYHLGFYEGCNSSTAL